MRVGRVSKQDIVGDQHGQMGEVVQETLGGQVGSAGGFEVEDLALVKIRMADSGCQPHPCHMNNAVLLAICGW